jgi:hypothetical protein
VATVELYLRDQVVRGELRTDAGRRAVDVLNESPSGVIALGEASARSIHFFKGSATKLGAVRVQRAHVLLVVPYDASLLGPRQVRAGYVEKVPRSVAVGLGPFFLTGTLHVGRYDAPSIELAANDPGGRTFVPLTDVRLRSQYDAEWWLDVELLLLNRAAISFTGSPPVP